MKILIIIFSLWASIATANSDAETESNVTFEPSLSHSTVLNGEFVKKNDPKRLFVVKLDIIDPNKKTQNHCTGILIENDIVLSAGHCFPTNNLQVIVKFGLGGKTGYTHVIRALGYRAMKLSNQSMDVPGDKFKQDGTLNINPDAQAIFYKNIEERTSFMNSVNINGHDENEFHDYAVIRIPKIPSEYGVIERFSGSLSYRQMVYHLGYGTSSLGQNQNYNELRYSRAYLVGYYRVPGQKMKGWQTFSPTMQQSCYGDSGGPLVIEDGGRLKVLGVNLFTRNRCGNENWYLDINYFENEINEMIQILRRTTST